MCKLKNEMSNKEKEQEIDRHRDFLSHDLSQGNDGSVKFMAEMPKSVERI